MATSIGGVFAVFDGIAAVGVLGGVGFSAGLTVFGGVRFIAVLTGSSRR